MKVDHISPIGQDMLKIALQGQQIEFSQNTNIRLMIDGKEAHIGLAFDNIIEYIAKELSR